MKIELRQKDIMDQACDLLVVNLFQGVTKPAGATGAADKALDGAIAQLIGQDHFEGKLGQIMVFPTLGKIKAKRVAVIGLGDKKNFDTDAVRKIGGHIVKLAMQTRSETVSTVLHGAGLGGLEVKAVAQALAEGLVLSAYRFHVYHGALKKKDKPPHELKDVWVCETEARTLKSAADAFERGEILADATNYARDLVNTPSAHMTPQDLLEAAKKIAGKGVSIKVLDKMAMEKLGMIAALAVGQGSAHEPVGVHLVYKPKNAKKKVAIVGKAVTFDSGGLNIKPGDSMTTMKIDMAGSASVIGLFKALPKLNPNVEVHGIFLAVENMPGTGAYRPGDVLKAMDGTTIEVLNTDAEGRITLADALSYAKTLQPDVIVDLATLTGACVVALGEEIAGLMSNNGKLADRLLKAARETGEPLWELPLYEPYNEHIKSKIADIKNVGARGQAGTISAAFFLKVFVGDTPWAHLDIAGPSYTEKESRPDQPYGASGYGVRLLAKWLEGV
ncbi:MAG: leucyl aminopeptidase [Patescibacteria group bacterium]|nr:leucyl aminopeptidase [Patescibacteria group bacterium]